MQLTVKGNHLNIGDALREHVRMNLSHTAEKYFRNPIEATVIFTKEKGHRYRADISVHVGGGILLQSHHEADDPYPAFDIAAARVATRLSRYKDKLRDHNRREKPAELLAAAYYTFQSGEPEAEGGNEPLIIAETQTNLITMAVADAVMRLELGDLPALLFRNPAHGGLNMVYRRKDGNIGWVEPAENTAQLAAKKAPAKSVGKKAVPKVKAKAKAKPKAAPKAKAKAKAKVKAKVKPAKPGPKKTRPGAKAKKKK